jgi:hypothetical protein
MIKCKDFSPWITERGPFGGPAEYESFSLQKYWLRLRQQQH